MEVSMSSTQLRDGFISKAFYMNVAELYSLIHRGSKIVSAIFLIGVASSQLLISRDLHICSNSNESVVKFRKNFMGTNYKNALNICLADKIIGKNSILFDWPIDLCDFWLSSLFGPRTHKGITKMHEGIDLAALKGTLVKASAKGIVTRADKTASGYGTLVEISHSKGFKTRYGHLDEILVQVGQKVASQEIIGTVGATGNVRGKRDPSHLHFEIMHHETKVNPLKYLYCAEVAFGAK